MNPSRQFPHPIAPASASVRWRIRLIAAAAGLLGAFLFSGCMHRRMTIHSNPPGARVLVDGKDIGLTPVSMNFLYYGTREITLIKDGYETKTVMQPMRMPWYQIPPLDFFSDNLSPTKITDRHYFSYDLQRMEHVPRNQLLENAKGLRSESKFGQ